MRGAALITFQVYPREQKNSDINQQHDCHPDEQWDVVGESKQADERQAERQYDDEAGHLGKGFLAIEWPATDQATSKLAVIIDCLIPVQKDVTIFPAHSDACGLFSGNDIKCSSTTPAWFSNHDPHSRQWYGLSQPCGMDGPLMGAGVADMGSVSDHSAPCSNGYHS